jgi:N-acetyl-anhydromuramyl-L-alanine amidase AmpD
MPLSVSRGLRLPQMEFFPESGPKSGIALHHTVGGNAASTINWWLTDRQMVGTAYMIDRGGTVHEIFDPTAWAWQFGLPWSDARRIGFERRFIGIEICSEGGLTESDGKLYCFDRISPRTEYPRSQAFDFGRDYRGYRWFSRYTPEQMDSLCVLIDELCTRFDIPRQAPAPFLDHHGEAIADFEGIIGHAMVRSDKTDPIPDAGFWERLERDCGIVAVNAVQIEAAPIRGFSQEDLDALFEHNVLQIDRMNVAAGSMVKGLIMELGRGGRGTYIRLIDAETDGHTVSYEYVQGDRSLIGRIARALGFASVTDTRLKVRGG